MYSAQCSCLTSTLNAWKRFEHYSCIHNAQTSHHQSINYCTTKASTSLFIDDERIDTYRHTFLSSAPIWFMSMAMLSLFHTHEWLVKYSSTIMALCKRVIVFIILRRHGNNKRRKARTLVLMRTGGAAFGLIRTNGDKVLQWHWQILENRLKKNSDFNIEQV